MFIDKQCLIYTAMVLGALTISSSLLADDSSTQTPNIIIIMADDHCKQAIGAYGGTFIKTPNIDRLANEGCRFDRMFSNNAICGPSRASLITGKYSKNNGFLANTSEFDRTQMTFPQELQKLGYETSIFGKWHLKTEPSGFDYFKLMHDHGHYYDCTLKEKGHDWKKKGKVHKGYLTDVITDESIAWLERRKDKSKPFMMMVHHKAPHGPHHPAPRHKDLFADTLFPEPETLYDNYAGRAPEAIADKLRNSRLLFSKYPQLRKIAKKKGTDKEKVKKIYQEYMRGYLRLVRTLDDNIGRLLDHLKSSGLDKNTIVIYTSDNGFFLGEHGFFNKMWAYEQAIHLPFIIRYPGQLKPGTTQNAMLSWIDVAPTLMELAGGKAPSEMDGRSFESLLRGKAYKQRTEVFYHFHDTRIIPEHKGLRTERYKIVHYLSFGKNKSFKPMWEFFDLKSDPNEMNNLINNPEYSEILKPLKAKLEGFEN